jgi:hypothetical protein
VIRARSPASPRSPARAAGAQPAVVQASAILAVGGARPVGPRRGPAARDPPLGDPGPRRSTGTESPGWRRFLVRRSQMSSRSLPSFASHVSRRCWNVAVALHRTTMRVAMLRNLWRGERCEAEDHGSIVQYGTGGSQRRRGFAVWPGSQIGTSCHQPSPTGIGRYSVEHPHQSGIWSVWGGRQPCGRRSLARHRIGATSRPQVQQARVGRRRPWTSSQVGGVMAPRETPHAR